MKQFKNYKCPRMRNLLGIYIYECVKNQNLFLFKLFSFYLAVQMADEYHNAKDYNKALT